MVGAVEDILAEIPMDQLAAQLGVDEATAEQATRQAIPALLGGMQANAEDPAGARSLAGALGDHPSDLIDGGVDLDQVDPDDGGKIVGNIFGPNQDQVAQTLGVRGATDITGFGLLGHASEMDQYDPTIVAYIADTIGHIQGAEVAFCEGPAGLAT